MFAGVCRISAPGVLKPGKQTIGHLNPEIWKASTGSTCDLFKRYITCFFTTRHAVMQLCERTCMKECWEAALPLKKFKQKQRLPAYSTLF